MTILNLPTVRYDGKREGGYVICKQGTKEIHAWTGNDSLLEEEAKPQNKEQAREKAKVDAYNPSMAEGLKGVFGGGDHTDVKLPLWDYLTPYEKRRISRAKYLYRKGDLAQLAVENDGVTNLNKIIENVYNTSLKIPREKRTTRKGTRYGTWNDNQGNQSGNALTTESRKR